MDFDEEFVDDPSPAIIDRPSTPVYKRKRRGELTGKEKKAENQRKKTFQDKWLLDNKFKGWLQRVKGNPHAAFCSVCERKNNCGKSDLEEHADGDRHKKKFVTVQSNRNLDSMFKDSSIIKHTEAVKTAEIQLASFFADKNVAFNTSDDLIAILKSSTKDSKIVKDMTLGRDKCNAIVRNVLAKTETEELVGDLKDNLFTILVDESTDQSGVKALCVLVRYIDPRTKKPRTTLLEMVTLDAKDCSAEARWNRFVLLLGECKIPVTNIIGMASGSANVMVGVHNSFWCRLKDACPWAILIPCACHSAAKVSTNACAKLPSNVDEHLRLLVNYMVGSPQRSAELQEFQAFYEEEIKKFVRLCATRWLVLHSCVERYLLLGSGRSLLGFFEHRCFEDPNHKDKDAHRILHELKNPFTKAYIQFLSYALNVMNEFNTLLQSKESLIHRLYELSHTLMRTLCTNFMKEEVLDRLGNINVTHPDYLLPEDAVELGPDCADTLRTIAPLSNTPEGRQQLQRDIRVFKQKCLHFYTTAAQEIQTRLPPKNELLKQMAILGPESLFASRSDPTALNDINGLIFHFKVTSVWKLAATPRFQRIHRVFASEGCMPIHPFSLLQEKLDLSVNVTTLKWKRLPLEMSGPLKEKFKALAVEELWVEMRALKNAGQQVLFPNLVKLADAVLIMPHSNADSERAFAIIKDVKSKKRNMMGAESENAICVFRISCRSKNTCCANFQVIPAFLAKHNKNM